jgi:hypothetical protein
MGSGRSQVEQRARRREPSPRDGDPARFRGVPGGLGLRYLLGLAIKVSLDLGLSFAVDLGRHPAVADPDVTLAALALELVAALRFGLAGGLVRGKQVIEDR